MALRGRPQPPDPGDCCGSGCTRCVWDVYYDALEAFEFATANDAPAAARPVNSAERPACVAVVLYDGADSLPAAPEDVQDFHCRRRLVRAPVREARRLTAADAPKEVITLQLDLTGSGLYYAPGDALRVHCPNREAVVHAVLERLGLAANQLLMVKPVCTLLGRRAPHYPEWIPERPMSAAHLLTHYVDLTSAPRTGLLHLLAESATDLTDRDCAAAWLASPERLADLLSARPSLPTLLARLPSSHPPLPRLLECLGQLKDRSYSVASAPLGWCSTVDLVAAVERDALPSGDTFLGHCSSWMTQCLDNEAALTHIPIGAAPPDRHQSFHLPSDLSLPLILIASGTGLAPFRSFYLHRQYLAKQRGCPPLGPWTLFYGCRHPDQDCLFQPELEQCLASGVLAALHVAYSRQEPPAYVWHLLLAQAAEVRRLMEQGAVVFVCGSPGMVRDVERTLGQAAGSPDTVEGWRAAGRLRIDAWK